MHGNLTKIVFGFAAIVIAQIVWHWLLTLPHHLADTLREVYFSYNPQSRKGVSGWFDLVLPGAVLGILTGRVGWNWPMRKLACLVILGAISLVLLCPVYTILFFNKEQAWWWPKTEGDFALWLVRNCFQTAVLIGVCTYGGRVVKEDAQKKKGIKP
jgi:hypothetical protein